MTPQLLRQVSGIGIKTLIFAAALMLSAALSGFAQDTKDADKLKVTFDENSSGVMIVESNGEKYRVDPVKKTVEKIAADEPAPKTDAKEETKPSTAPPEEEEEDEYDFEPGYEPYGYRLINLATPRSVPKKSWNMNFSHRFSQSINPIKESARDLLGFDSMSVSSFGVSYGITDKLYVSASRSPLCQKGLCKTIEVGVGYNWLRHSKNSPVALTTYASIEGNDNFTEEYTYNLQTMVSGRLGKRVYLFFSPTLSLNANGQHRFNPRAEDFFPPATAAVNAFSLPNYTASFGFGAAVLINPHHVALFEFTPRIGFKLGRIDAIYDADFNVTGFQSVSKPSIGFGYQWNIGKHSFAITLSNTQTSTTSRSNSSNLVLSPKNMVIGFNLFRRW
ncbi:MAG: hypothetical protein JSS81_22165 [Acidobacteria bacterium]|nr:hypothetical protein [Acidobacteriota bacterium]